MPRGGCKPAEPDCFGSGPGAMTGAPLPLRDLPARPIVDGYADDWPEPASALVYRSDDERLVLELLGGWHDGQRYLFCHGADATPSALPAS